MSEDATTGPERKESVCRCRRATCCTSGSDGTQPDPERKSEGTVTGRISIQPPASLYEHLYPNLKTVSDAEVIDIDYQSLEDAVLAPYSLDDVRYTFYVGYEPVELPNDSERSD